jgi:hypothetical protein
MFESNAVRAGASVVFGASVGSDVLAGSEGSAAEDSRTRAFAGRGFRGGRFRGTRVAGFRSFRNGRFFRGRRFVGVRGFRRGNGWWWWGPGVALAAAPLWWGGYGYYGNGYYGGGCGWLRGAAYTGSPYLVALSWLRLWLWLLSVGPDGGQGAIVDSWRADPKFGVASGDCRKRKRALHFDGGTQP